MINKNKEQTKLEFRNGDIGIASGFTVEDNELEKVFVVFDNQEPRKIGPGSSIESGWVDIKDFPVIMTFTKAESIDAVISQLEEAKMYLKDSKEWEKYLDRKG